MAEGAEEEGFEVRPGADRSVPAEPPLRLPLIESVLLLVLSFSFFCSVLDPIVLVFITASEGSGRSEESIREITSLLDSAVRDCVPQERNSFVAFQARTGVEVCTFSLILKNAASLLDDGDPLKLAAAASLDDLTSSFGSLNDALRKGSLQIDDNRKVAEMGSQVPYLPLTNSNRASRIA
ncbi:hypothetical protein QJS10_CPB19g00561 [Acorus calamus]|uniref:Uncharacterized protein n=1 Tax=Acorus calamus TaxID=4465 RepID=A0AAV9CIY8_ACOCL|nr:hypothetical protein QJS10_CPB19g00561 [Acorus calamus]